jgi:hypothetical protein
MVRKSDTIHAIRSKTEQTERGTHTLQLACTRLEKSSHDRFTSGHAKDYMPDKSSDFPTHTLRLSFRLKSVLANRTAKRNVCGGLKRP